MKKTLIVYFSATGTTKAAAQRLAKEHNADLYEITPEQPYTAADLDWRNEQSRSSVEMRDPDERPTIKRCTDVTPYDTVYVGFPIWWGEEPRIMDTFAESYNFDGITVIPFCTSGSSGIGRSGQNLADNAGSGNWIEGKRFGGGASEDEIRSWIEGLQ